MQEKSKNELMVTIRCLAYNHEPYIRQCLEGFVMQKTNFRFEAVVHDDASTDGTAAIIREYAEKYPDIIKPIFETENQYSKRDGSLTRIVNKHVFGKYVAICEGDDYWIDPLKLQKQVDFMEVHPKHSMCFHAHNICYNDGTTAVIQMYDNNMEICPINDLILGDADIVATNSMLYRRELYIEKPSWVQKLSFGDFTLELVLAERGFVGYLKDIMSCYRLNSLGSWNSSINNDIKKQIKHRKERILMWNEYNKWTNYSHSYPVYKMLFYDRCRLLSLKYLDYFDIKDSVLLKIVKYIYHKIK